VANDGTPSAVVALHPPDVTPPRLDGTFTPPDACDALVVRAGVRCGKPTGEGIAP
jgi:hypothetical protein